MKQELFNFIPQRLISAREARGITATTLADLTGVTKQSISAYEKGKQKPSSTTLSNIAEKLNVPIHFFLKAPIENADTIFFRSLGSATKRARLRAIRRLDWLEEIITYLSYSIDLLPVTIPNFDIGKNPDNLSLEKIEEIAVECRHKLGFGDGPISNIVQLFERNGVIIVRQELDSSTLDAFSKWSTNINAPIIVLGTDKNSAVRSRLDVAHEMGHIIFHRSLDKIGSFLKIIEEQAFRFASAFLLPAEGFTKDFVIPDLDAFWMLKEKWKVSIGVMIKRCHELNIINDNQATKLWIGYTQRQWRKREPFDDTLPIEKPVFIQKCFDLLSDEEIFKSCEDLRNALSLYESDIEELTGLPRGYLRQDISNIEPLPVLRKNNHTVIDTENIKGSIVPFKRKV